MTGRLLLVAACAVVPLAAGCDQCEHYGQLRCQGDMLQECIDDGDGPFANFRWVPRGCAVTCRQSGGSAACVDSREPVPECAGDPEGGICFEGTPSGCWDQNHSGTATPASDSGIRAKPPIRSAPPRRRRAGCRFPRAGQTRWRRPGPIADWSGGCWSTAGSSSGWNPA